MTPPCSLQALKAPRGLPKFRRRQADGRPALPSNLQLDDDAYAELYPERFGGFAEELDSDEESKAAKEDKEQEGADKKKLQVRFGCAGMFDHCQMLVCGCF